MNSTREDRIKEILEYANEQKLNKKIVRKLTDKKFTERELHALVWMFREHLPIEIITLASERETALGNDRVLINAYHSDEIPNDFVFECLKGDDISALKEKIEEIEAEREAFQYSLQANHLFRSSAVYHLLNNNEIIYIRHEFNWNTYESRLVLSGGNTKLYFPMPQIPLIGGCWSNLVAERMLMGQMYLQYVFKSAAASLEFIKTVNSLSCKIVPCDNCFYAPYLYFYKNEDGSMNKWIGDSSEKVYMDYLIREYPESYQWLMNRPEGKYFYDDFYSVYTPEITNEIV